MVIDGIDYAAYRETDSSPHDSDKNRLFGAEHYKSGRPILKPSSWVQGDFEGVGQMRSRWNRTFAWLNQLELLKNLSTSAATDGLDP